MWLLFRANAGVLLFWVLSISFCRSAWGAPSVPTVINADKMLAENIQNEIHFVGHVHLVKKNLILKSDNLDVFFVPPARGATLMDNMHARQKSQKIQTMIATGHVYIKKGNRVAYAGKAVYVARGHFFVLTRLPVVIQNGDRISGEKITFFTRIDKSLVQGHSLMLLHPSGKKGKKEQKPEVKSPQPRGKG
ncbi:MAG: LptA/OstA family protein [Nitrospirae bacterium]|nr:LptA/OstA family protein [Nitrospirota bacterium]